MSLNSELKKPKDRKTSDQIILSRGYVLTVARKEKREPLILMMALRSPRVYGLAHMAFTGTYPTGYDGISRFIMLYSNST